MKILLILSLFLVSCLAPVETVVSSDSDTVDDGMASPFISGNRGLNPCRMSQMIPGPGKTKIAIPIPCNDHYFDHGDPPPDESDVFDPEEQVRLDRINPAEINRRAIR